MKHNLDKLGYLEIQSGVYLHTKENLIEEQKSWPDEDSVKNIDFSEHDYWITDDAGSKPEGVDSIEEGCFKIFGIEACRKFLGE